MGKSPTIWMRGLRAHTYLGRPQDEGSVYLAHEHEVENIENLKFAVRDNPPPKAVRPVEAQRPSVPAESLAPPEMAGVARVARQAPIPAKLPARPGTSDDPPDPQMQPWPTPSATVVDPPAPVDTPKLTRRKRRGATVESVMRGGDPKVED